MSDFVIPFSELGKDALDLVGGKGANLAELRRIGIQVPDGFCLTTNAFRRFLEADENGMDKHYARLEHLDPDDRAAVSKAGANIRNDLRRLPVPEDVRAEILGTWRRIGDGHPHAVRSSATAEDLADASFAGQHDTFLNVSDEPGLLDSVRRCWMSL